MEAALPTLPGGYALLANRDPAFAEASLRNALLMQACSKIVHGIFREHGDPACITPSPTQMPSLARWTRA